MTLPLGWSVLLLVAAIWNLLVWPQFLRRVLKDPRARNDSGGASSFLIVHVWLVSISLALGIGIGVLGLLTLF